MKPLVSTEWLAAELGAPDLRVLDCSFYMPAEKLDPASIFAEGHIPGAQFFDLETIADIESELPHMVPGAARFARMVAALGVSSHDRVVFYDQKGIFSSARGWWMMRLFGHDSTAVLDGGLPKWRREQRAVAQGVSAAPAMGIFNANLRASRLRGLGDMLDNVGSARELVLDARAVGRYAGTSPEPRPGLPSGHIPGARSLPASDLLSPEQTMLPPETLRARFAAVGADGKQPVVTSCGTGVSAAILTLGRAIAGLEEGALYDGSWTEWGGRPETPKETN